MAVAAEVLQERYPNISDHSESRSPTPPRPIEKSIHRNTRAPRKNAKNPQNPPLCEDSSVDIDEQLPDGLELQQLEEEVKEIERSPVTEDDETLTTLPALEAYYKDVGNRKLLNFQQELEHGKNVFTFLKLQNQIKKNPTKELLSQYPEAQDKYDKSREILIVRNLRLVISCAMRYRGSGIPVEELIQEGNIGLIRGVEKYDYRKGFRFSTYVYWWIRQAVTRYIADQGRIIRVPVHTGQAIPHLNRAERRLIQRLERTPTNAELAAELELKEDKVKELKQARRNVVSLDSPIGQDSDTTLGDMVADEKANVEDAAEGSVLSEEVDTILKRLLQPREAAVLHLRYGLGDGLKRTLAEVGDELQISRERVRQIEQEALKKLRKPEFRQFLESFE